MLLVLVTTGILALLTGGIGIAGVYAYYTRDIPSPDRLVERETFSSTKILDRNGRLLYELFDPQAGKRRTVALSEISPYLIQATVAIEDDTFYENQGISPRGIARAILTNLQGGEQLQGGSTITQQLIKLVLLTPEVSIERKVQEWILAYQVNQLYTKDQILEWYLNEIPYGNMAYGIEAAAEAYFGKSARELDLAEASMLAGIPQAPALLSPLVDPAAAKRRQQLVLNAMVAAGYISEFQAKLAAEQTLQYQPMRYGIEAPHFVMYVRGLMERKYGTRALYSGGLTVYTSLDLEMQKVAERVARQRVEKLAENNIHNAALVAMRPNTGEILAMLGSVDYFNQDISGQVNIVTAERQPGSTFKPITYAAAFQKGWAPATVILDASTVFRDSLNRPYTPRNVDNKWSGPVSVRTALGNSMNIPAVKTIEFVGVQRTIDLAHQMGITSLPSSIPYDLSVTLGGGEVKMLDLIYAYSVFANQGAMYGQLVPLEQQKPGYRKLEPVAILKVEDASGNILEEYSMPERVEVISPQIAYQITSILSDDDARRPLFAPNGPLKLSRPAAAKTGTTDTYRDLWTIGYTPDLVTGVWVGNSDNREIRQALTTMSAAPIWHDFMEEVLASSPAREFERPSGLEEVEVCAISGALPGPYCPVKRRDLFVRGTAPTHTCDIHRLVVVDKTTGNLANLFTAPENREQKVIEVYPPEWAEWAKSAGKTGMPKPAEAPQVATGAAEQRDDDSALVITSPTDRSAVRGVVEIAGWASGRLFASYLVEFGEGLNPSSWRSIGGQRNSPVQDGVLERWDTSSLDGPYTLRVTLTEKPADRPRSDESEDEDDEPEPGPSEPRTKVVELKVVVDNEPPAIELTSPRDAAEIKDGQKVQLRARVTDNHQIGKTDFYVDGRLVGSSTEGEAAAEWTATPGPHIIRAIAWDSAGNETQSKEVKITVR
jgi:1A family penicillin-binding protein